MEVINMKLEYLLVSNLEQFKNLGTHQGSAIASAAPEITRRAAMVA